MEMLNGALEGLNGINISYFNIKSTNRKNQSKVIRTIERKIIEWEIEQLRNTLNHIVEQEECLFNEEIVEVSVKLDKMLNAYANFQQNANCDW